MFRFDENLKSRIRDNIANFPDRRAEGETLTHAAVAVTVVNDGPDGAFLITRRSSRLKDHKGQWALPGGRVDPGETAIEAALREMDEEIGVRLPESAVIGLLDDYPTRSGFRITPVVVWGGKDVETQANPDEVASIHTVTLQHLADEETPEFATIPESERPLIKLNMINNQIHAPTAAVLYQFREVALFGRKTRVDHLEQPVWAWQ